jgi:hypothetical protein
MLKKKHACKEFITTPITKDLRKFQRKGNFLAGKN